MLCSFVIRLWWLSTPKRPWGKAVEPFQSYLDATVHDPCSLCFGKPGISPECLQQSLTQMFYSWFKHDGSLLMWKSERCCMFCVKILNVSYMKPVMHSKVKSWYLWSMLQQSISLQLSIMFQVLTAYCIYLHTVRSFIVFCIWDSKISYSTGCLVYQSLCCYILFAEQTDI